jgi:hypothetical protein
MTNLFTVIENDDDEFVPTSREKFLRKAAKKLNEIERLEEKGKYHVLTREECEKLNQKDFWWACLYNEKLEPKKPSENKNENKKKNKKEEERKRKEAEIKRREERKEEERRKEEQKKEEDKKRKIVEILNKKTNNIEEEYRELLLLHNGNNNKTFRMLSLKYHPDKNVGKLEWANEMQKKLGLCREKYISDDDLSE